MGVAVQHIVVNRGRGTRKLSGQRLPPIAVQVADNDDPCWQQIPLVHHQFLLRAGETTRALLWSLGQLPQQRGTAPEILDVCHRRLYTEIYPHQVRPVLRSPEEQHLLQEEERDGVLYFHLTPAGSKAIVVFTAKQNIAQQTPSTTDSLADNLFKPRHPDQ